MNIAPKPTSSRDECSQSIVHPRPPLPASRHLCPRAPRSPPPISLVPPRYSLTASSPLTASHLTCAPALLAHRQLTALRQPPRPLSSDRACRMTMPHALLLHTR